MANANLAQGTKFSVSTNGSIYTQVGLLNSITAPNRSAPSLETTDLDSTAASFLKGLPDFGEVSGNFRYDSSDAANALINTNLAAYGSDALMYCKISLAGMTTPETWSGRGFFTSHTITNETNAVRTGSFTFKISGALTKS